MAELVILTSSYRYLWSSDVVELLFVIGGTPLALALLRRLRRLRRLL